VSAAAGGGEAAGARTPSQEELQAAYEAELGRVSVTDLVAQSAVTLLNVAARRLGPPAGRGAPAAGEEGAGGVAGGRDLEQVRDAIDAARALLEILERRMPREARPLRDALSQLQMAYATEVRAGAAAGSAEGGARAAQEPEPPAGEAGAGEQAKEPGTQEQASRPGGEAEEGAEERRPGPAEASGRLWVPGR
jgi:hypothetical protein